MRSPADIYTSQDRSDPERPRLCRNAAVLSDHVVRSVRIYGEGELPPVGLAGASLTSPLSGCSVVICTHRRPAAVQRFIESLANQLTPVQLLIVDASPDDSTEIMLEDRAAAGRLPCATDYLRVDGPLRGLTPQRNLALEYVTAQLVGFFDDDVVLLPGALEQLVVAILSRGVRAERLAGVGAVIENELARPNALWQVRRALGVVPSLRPGAYTTSGMSVPWRFLPLGTADSASSSGELVEGDWLPGGAMVWRTEQARSVGFCEKLGGYASGEDLEFSLRMREHGPLAVETDARVLHLPAAGGRPDQSAMGYLGARNLFHIHQTCRGERPGWQTAYFLYAFAVDTLVRLMALARPGSVPARWAFVRGRFHFFRTLIAQPRRTAKPPLSMVGADVGRSQHG